MRPSRLLCLIGGVIAFGPLLGIAFRQDQVGSELQTRDSEAPPPKPNIVACGGAVVNSVGRLLGCGADGCAWQLDIGDWLFNSTSGSAILKVAKDASSQKSVEKDCSFAKKMEAAGVQNAMKCLGSCESGGNKAVALYPFLQNKMEFGPNPIDLGQMNQHAVGMMLRTAWQMLHGGFVNTDQANNVLYSSETGDPLFIDFGRAVQVTKPVTSSIKRRRLTMMVRSMVYDLVIGTVPVNLCQFARDTVRKLQTDMPPSEFVAPFVDEALEVVERRWEQIC
mmetsp:Transcript_7933/g.21520  ORF Transcript_7933/g.21520 Transcript_7933/m.21520 type:complete len:279 (+) Transcript_7933:86-922(+)